MKRILGLLLVPYILVTCVSAQINCATSTKLVCQIPFATGAASPGATEAATAAANAFNGPIAAQLSQLPLPNAATGIIAIYNPAVKGFEPLETLGPIMTDRAQTIGAHRLFLGFSFQQFNFNSIDGFNLTKIPFAYQAQSQNDNSQYVSQLEHISFKYNQYVGIATFGLNTSTDVTLVVPFERVSVGVGTTGSQYFVGPNGQPLGQLPNVVGYVPGTASGFGDTLAGIKHDFFANREQSRWHLAGGLLVRIPSGDAQNYLGSGAWGLNPYASVSYYQRVISPHARFGYQWNSHTILLAQSDGNELILPGGLQYDFGADVSVIPRKFTIAADFLGNQYLNSPTFYYQSFPIPSYQPQGVPNLATKLTSYTVSNFSIGVKWNPWKSLLLYGNVLVQLNDAGMKSSPVPLAGISYTFDFKH